MYARALASRTTLAAALLSVSACSPFSGYETRPPAIEAGADDGELDAGSGDSDAPSPPAVDLACASTKVPRRPRIISGGAGDALEISVVIRSVDMGDTDDEQGVPRYLRMGVDLDGTCTGQGGAASCRQPPWAPYLLDGPDGRDNSLGALGYQLHRNGGGSASDAANGTTAQGVLTSGIHVRGYNGSSTDNAVQVAFYAATRVARLGAQPPPPLWDGSDVWQVLDAWVDLEADAMDPPPRYADTEAYVVDDVLVAHFPHLQISIGMLSQAVLMAEIEAVGDSFRLRDGTIAGRLAIDDTLTGLENVIDDVTGEHVCTDHPGYAARKQRLCAQADITFAGPDDGSAECDAGSFAWQFQTERAVLSGVAIAALVAARYCEPEVRPEHDSCADLLGVFGAPEPQW